MKKRALISGITGQDGSYLAELLLEKDYEVYGIIRRSATNNFENINHILSDVNLEYGDLLDLSSLHRIMKYIKPDEIYNLASQSHVGISFTQPVFTAQVTGIGALNMLEAFRENVPYSKFYQAGSSEMFGNNHNGLFEQNEDTPFKPASPYACAKVFAHNIGCNYRRAYDLFIANGILFNHESPRRGDNFVTQKIVKAAYNISIGKQDKLELGNLDACRDWGHAEDYVYGMWLMLQHNNPDDFVLATGTSSSVKLFCSSVFEKFNLYFENYVVTNEKYVRPEDVAILIGNSYKAKKILGWKPKYNLDGLIDSMVEAVKEE